MDSATDRGHGCRDGPEVVRFSNKKCAHAATHDCPYLVDSNASLCAPCTHAAANGHPCY